jgi:peptidoglycan-N-acetylglucosamine deacetylase
MDFTIYRTPAWVRWLYPTLTWRKPTDQKVIYLTFDDGPVPGVTEQVLQILAQFQAKATFFCIGDNVRKHPQVFQSVLDAGHAVGNHTFNHLKGWSTPLQAYVENTKQCDALVNQPTTGQTLKLFRPPYGRITRAQIAALSQYEIVMWDVLSYDYQPYANPAQHLQGTIKATRPGSIVVFHDSYKAQANLTFILPRYLEHFVALGYQFHSLIAKQ